MQLKVVLWVSIQLIISTFIPNQIILEATWMNHSIAFTIPIIIPIIKAPLRI